MCVCVCVCVCVRAHARVRECVVRVGVRAGVFNPVCLRLLFLNDTYVTMTTTLCAVPCV